MEYQNTFQWKESVASSYHSCWKYHNQSGSSYPLHCHPYYELSFVMQGKRQENYNGGYYEVTEGTLFFHTPLTIHGFTNLTTVEDMILQFSPGFLLANATAASPNTILKLKSEEKPYIQVSENPLLVNLLKTLHGLCNNVAQFQQEDTPSLYQSIRQNMNTSIQLLQLIDILIEEDFLTFQEEAHSYSDIAILDPVINRLLSHPEHMPAMEEAARMANVSYYHFSRLFKKATGFNYQSYCNHLRLQYAEELLLHSDMSIAEITTAIGMETNSGFTRLFKRVHGVSPLQYRRRQQEVQ